MRRAWAMTCFGCVLLVILCMGGEAGGSDAVSAAGKAPLYVGVCLPEDDHAGGMQRKALMVAQRIRPQVRDRRVQLVIKDTLGTASGAREAVRAVLDEQAVAGIIGGAGTEEAAAILDALATDRRTRRAPVPAVVTTATGPLEAPRGVLQRVCTPLTDQARVAAAFAIRGLKDKRAGIVFDPSDPAGVRLASLFSSAFIAQGGTVADIVYLNRKDNDYRTQMVALARKKPEILFFPAAAMTPQVIVSVRVHGLKAPCLVANLADTGAFIKDLGPVKDVYVVTDFLPEAVTAEDARRCLAEFRKQFGEMDASAALAADAYFLLTDMLAQAPSSKGRFSLKQILGMSKNRGYLTGAMNIGPSGAVERDVYVGVIQGSRLNHVDTLRP